MTVSDGPNHYIGADREKGWRIVRDRNRAAVVSDSRSSKSNIGGTAQTGRGTNRDQGRAGNGRQLRIINDYRLRAGGAVAVTVSDRPDHRVGADREKGWR